MTGVEENLSILVMESSIAAGYRTTIRINLNSTLLPLKATLVWMDPPNTIMSSKMLLNNLDLQVTQTLTGTVYHGNGIQGDEYNNVSL